MKQLNTVFLHMFDWFITKYGQMITKDHKANWQRIAANWHPFNSFELLAARLFIGASYASAARYPMDNRDAIDIGLRIIKRCGMYAKEYKNWILHKNAVPPIVETIDSFKKYWADAIALVNQTAAPASQHGYSMTAVDNNELLAPYGDSLTNFNAMYAAMQEAIKSQVNSLVAMQG